jgi:arylsulfatase A-like enzyme
MQNVLLILTDEQRFDALGANGNPHVQTPHLDAFAAGTLNFRQHRISTPLCTPSRASLLTGQYARTHGTHHVGFALNRGVETLAHRLRTAGYTTAFFGKSHLEAESSGFNAAIETSLRDYYGFATAQLSEDDLEGPYLHWLKREHPQWVAAAWDQANEGLTRKYGTDESGRLRAVYASELPPELSQSSWITRQTEAFLREQSDAAQPFFAVCSYVPPHHPWTPPRACLGRYDAAAMPVPSRLLPAYGLPSDSTHGVYTDGASLGDAELQRLTAAYYALCSHLDDCIGRLLRTLEATGAAGRTLVIFTSDHGDHLGNRGMIRKGANLFDDLLHVPLLVRAPGESAPRGARHELTQHEDLAPTILDFLGLPIPPSIQGLSFASVLRGAHEPAPRQHQFFEYLMPDKPHARVGVGDRRYKLVRYHPQPGWVLIDREADPAERHNLAGTREHAATEERLRAALFEWLSSTGVNFGPKPFAW